MRTYVCVCVSDLIRENKKPEPCVLQCNFRKKKIKTGLLFFCYCYDLKKPEKKIRPGVRAVAEKNRQIN